MCRTFVVLWSALTTLTVATLAAGSNGNGRPFTINFCSAISGDAQGYVVLETKPSSSWPRDKFCLAVAEGAAEAGNYNLTLQLFNDLGFGNDIVNNGYPGVAYNVRDSMNYYFIYFRPNSAATCYQTGYVQETMMTHRQTSKCPQGPPKGRKWFTVHLHISHRTTRLFLDGVRTVTFLHHHDNIARGGAIVPNGFKNQVLFVATTSNLLVGRSQIQVAGCTAHLPGPQYNTLEETSGTFPGCCRVLIGPGIAGTKYRLSVDLYNVQGAGGFNRGRPAVMYNAHDIQNFDIVYFRPESTKTCYQTGYIRHGHMKFDGCVEGRCRDGPPAGRRWFNVHIHVDGATAAIYKDGVLIHTAMSKLEPTGRGGVVVVHGYKNLVRYKNFRISAQ